MITEADFKKWMELDSSPFIQAFAYRVLAKRNFKQGTWSKAIEYSQEALNIYPNNNSYRIVAEREYVKYLFAPLVLEKFNNPTALIGTNLEKDPILIN